MDSLIHALNSRGFYTIGYADNLTILLTRHCEDTLASLMQTALRLVEKWCATNSLGVNPHKTELVLFTKKRLINIRKLLSLFGTQLKLFQDVKCLGVTMDNKLKWKWKAWSKCSGNAGVPLDSPGDFLREPSCGDIWQLSDLCLLMVS